MSKLKVKGKFDFGDLIISLLITLGGGLVVSWFTSNSQDLYGELVKPCFFPPPVVFQIVWPILYILMAVAAYIILQREKNGQDIKGALKFYGIQLFLNFLWSFIFFKFQLYGLAFIELIILWIFILITFIKFIKVDKVAGILLVPYLLWVTYAGVLNFFIWMLNEM